MACSSTCPTQDCVAEMLCKRCDELRECFDWFRRADGRRVYPCKPCQAGAREDRKYAKYGLTVDTFNDLREMQRYACAICEQRGDLVIDHDHSCCPKGGSCGRCVRGLLCARCNVGIGMLGDDPDVMRRAIEYVTR